MIGWARLSARRALSPHAGEPQLVEATSIPYASPFDRLALCQQLNAMSPRLHETSYRLRFFAKPRPTVPNVNQRSPS
jgi:hypothetical protein